MADEQTKSSDGTDGLPDGEPSRKSLFGRLNSLRDWTAASKLRSVAVGGALLLLVVATVGTWLYLATLTVAQQAPNLAEALEAYDAGELEEARLLVVRIIEVGDLAPEEFGGPLFVLGAVKAAEADSQWSPLLRQSDFLVAAKYLREAQIVGFPEGRKEEGDYLLGRSLIESGDNAKGLEVLEAAVLDSPTTETGLHIALAAAYTQADNPAYAKALSHLDTALGREDLVEPQKSEARLKRIAILAKLGQFDDARLALKELPAEHVAADRALLAASHVRIEALRHYLRTEVASTEAKDALVQAVADSIKQLQAIPAASEVAEPAMFLVGEAQTLLGQTDAAINQFERVRRLYASSPVGIAASIAEGDLYRARKLDFAQALTAYRRSLSALEVPSAYRNAYLPINELRQKILQAHADFIARDEFVVAVTLVEQLENLLGRTRQIELRASTFEGWGKHLLMQSKSGVGNPSALEREARTHLREAGVDFEELAKRRFATSHYTDDVWNSAESYLEGQSYTNAVRMLREYLRNEPVQRNAQALLRLGQANLAQSNYADGILALDECIELHPQDAAVFRARLDCARAFRDQSKNHEAEQLLLSNLNGSGLSPNSPEWRDSLFELGRLLHDAGRYDAAIDRLDEAVQWLERFPNQEQQRLAMYLIAESHRHASEVPLAELSLAKTANERESSTSDLQDHLNEALRYYEKVRVAINRSEQSTPLSQAMLRNCYMFKGAVLFRLGEVERSPQRYKDAIDEYSNVSTLYQNEPFVLETFVQIASCQRRLQQPDKARLNIDQALQLLNQLPEDADYLAATNFDRNQWERMLTEMLVW